MKGRREEGRKERKKDNLIKAFEITAWSRTLLEKLTVPQPVKQLSVFYGPRRFIAALSSAHHFSIS